MDTPFVIELDDRMTSLARAGRVLSSARGAGIGGASSAPFAADLARRLAEHPPGEGEGVWIAAPASADARSLGAVLDVARGTGLAVEGFVDSATVTVAALALERSAVVLELGLHHVAATAVDGGAQTRRRRASVSRRGGLIELEESWLSLIGTAMVKQARFDPLHDAVTEQQLRVALPGMMRDLSNAPATRASVTRGSERFDVDLSRDQFAAAAQPVYREILRLLHDLRPAGAPIALLMPISVAALPGLRDMLQQFVGCELVALPEGFAASATSLLDLPRAEGTASARLLRRLPSLAQAALIDRVTRESLGAERAAGPAPSHVLVEGKAYALGGSLVVGRSVDGSPSITLPEGLAGVSRRHCTFVSENGELSVIDHSHFGTFLNGERVAERARVHAGDRIRVGEPGIQLSLISLG